MNQHPRPGRDLSATDLIPTALGGGRVLVVEEDEDAVVSLTVMLRLNGFDARAARTAAAALAAASDARSQVAVLDLDLPDGDGCEVIRRLRALPAAPAVVVVTGHTDLARRRAAADAGAAAVLLKPADPIELVRLVNRLCGEHS
jgi:DNA-binding response OmpR family regulator